MNKIIINKSSDILNFSDIYNHDFIIDKKLLEIKQNILVLKKIIEKFPSIKINWLKNKELYIFINSILHKNKLDYLYREYKILIKWIWCNAKCPMCFDWKRWWDLEKQMKVLDSVIIDLLNENIEIKNVDILGWEPLLIYDKILEILKILYKNKIKLTFTTNASLLDKNKIDELINAWLETFVFSLDFPWIKHNLFRSLEHTFEKIVEYTNYIKSKWKQVNWNTVVGKFNIVEILDFKTLYEHCKPNKHTFILIEENYKITNWSLMPSNYDLSILEKNILKYLKKNDIEIILNWFKKNILVNNICHIPLYKKSYIIKNNKVNISPCYTHNNISDFDKFADKAINWKCDEICDSSFKKTYDFI